MLERSINVFLDLPVKKMTEIAQEAEELGFNKCWVYDEGLITRDPYVTLAAMAQKTSKIRLGTGITNPFTRHPGITAAAIASLDDLSDGRAFLGIGAGGSLTLDPLGIEMVKPLTAVRELITTTRALFEGETVDFDGQVVKFSSASIPYFRKGIEIWLAGRGPKMLTMGGELADGVALDSLLKESLPEWTELVRKGSEISGNQPGVCFSTMVITTDAALEEARPHMTYRLVNQPAAIRERIGLSDEDTNAIHNAMASGLEAAGKLVKDEWMAPFVIMGSVDECVKEVREICQQNGITEFMAPILNSAEASRSMQEIIVVLEQV
jgi:5,10-methylenetetrahydromethanopterin reductase